MFCDVERDALKHVSYAHTHTHQFKGDRLHGWGVILTSVMAMSATLQEIRP